MPKATQNYLVDLLTQFKESDMSPVEMADLLRGLMKLQPDLFEDEQTPPKPKRKTPSRSATASGEGKSEKESAPATT
jgi:hypothetical protein